MPPARRQIIEHLSQLQAVGSPIRQEIVDVILSRGRCSISDIAEELGRPADGIYYHIKALLKEELVVEAGTNMKDRRQEKLYSTLQCGSLLEAEYDLSDPDKIRAMNKIVNSMLKIALKDFSAGFEYDGAVVDGEDRNLWAARIKSRLTGAQVRKVNRLLEEIASVFNHQKKDNSKNLYSIAWVLAPVEAKAKRRA